MIKKIAAIAGAGAILFGITGPVLAVDGQNSCHCFLPWLCRCRDRNVAVVDNSATAVADTGGNSQDNLASVERACDSDATAGSEGNRSITTGNANAYAGAMVMANVNRGCALCGPRRPETNRAEVLNWADAYAGTGDNHQDDVALVERTTHSDAEAGDEEGGNRAIRTGNAKATSRAWTVVNSQWSWGMAE